MYVYGQSLVETEYRKIMLAKSRAAKLMPRWKFLEFTIYISYGQVEKSVR